MLKGYKIITFTPVYLDGVFQHTMANEYVVRAINEERALKKIELEKAHSYSVGDTTIEVKDEYIYSVSCLGQAIRIIKWEYLNANQDI